MRRSRASFLAAIWAIAIVAGGCAAQANPGWTYAPVVVPSGSAGTSSAPPGPASTPAASSPQPPGGATVIDITARNVAFEQTRLTAPANVPLTIHFDNEDSGVPHDVAIYRGSAEGQQVFQGAIVTGVASTDYHVPALPAGTYTVICTVHPTLMTAILTIQ
ncbi:MAG: cupredoxin domain-containing protein [Chloroflexi bacterium]|nr:cupredoxin domain-containing protein [Chloroflexota bacterium]